MPALADNPLELHPGLRGLEAFCAAIDEPLEPYQRRIARAYFGAEREVAAVLPAATRRRPPRRWSACTTC